jgi:preprotein translocase subunit SecE
MGSTRALEWNPAVLVENGRQYLSDVRTEFRKVTWPSQREYVGGTIGVVVIVAILTLVLGLIDMGLSQIMELVLR